MIINRTGAEFLYKGVIYRIGDTVIGNAESEYARLNGTIFEIRDGADKETENETPDIYCSFNAPVLPADIAKLEETFSDLYDERKTLDDITLDMVIMAPEMLTVPGQPPKTIKVYTVTEDWTVDGDHGSTTRVFSDILEAKAVLNMSLESEIASGCISDWADKEEYMTEVSECSYEGWLEGHYSENHYTVSIEELEMSLSSSVIGDVGRAYIDAGRYEDFASQVAEWDEVEKLSEQEYQKYLADKRIPDMIDKNLGDYYWESYWEAVSEAAHMLLREYLGQCEYSENQSGQETQLGGVSE